MPPESKFYHHRQLNGLWVLAAMLLLLHLAIWIDFNSAISRSIILAHLGLFFIWQPLWGRDQVVPLRAGLLFILFTAAFIYWLNWWIICLWISLLVGLVSGLTVENTNERRAYFLTLVFLVSEMLIRATTQLFNIPALDPHINNLFRYGLFLLPFLIFLISWDTPSEAQIRPLDFFRSITMAMLSGMLAAGSLLIMYHSGVEYAVALLQALIYLSVFLFILGWLSSPTSGFNAFAQLWERSILNIGTPFEQWLGELAELAEREKHPEAFFRSAMQRLVNLPWIEAVHWRLVESHGGKEAVEGSGTRHRFDIDTGTFSVSLYTRRAAGPTLRMHCKLLIELVHHFYEAKHRELELMQQTHLQAIYETGARVTHDIKNLLQSLQTITSVLESEDNSTRDTVSGGQQLLQKQLPHITQRLQLALDKLRDPEDVTIEHMSLQSWWKKLQQRLRSDQVLFQASIQANPIIPFDLFDSVIENLMENAYFKSQTETPVTITISLLTAEQSDRHTEIKLSVCDNGSAVPDYLVNRLFLQPTDSNSGLGIGLYQAARQAELNDYTLKLVHNELGRVCFQLSKINDLNELDA